MNVLQIVPELNAGGVEKTTLEMAEALIAHGHAAHILSAGGRMEPDLAQIGGILHRYNIGSKNLLSYFGSVAKVKSIMKAHDIDLVHVRSRAPAWPAYRAARSCGVPYLATYHGIYNARSRLKTTYNAIMTKGELTIANSKATKAHIIKTHQIAENKIVTIARGVDLSTFDPAKISAIARQQTRQGWSVEDHHCVILLPGRLTAWKGQSVAIQALASLPSHFRLIIMGDSQGRDGYVSGLERLIADLGVAHKCQILPHNTDMAACLFAADMVLSTSIEPEAFGRVAIEAQAMGKPIIATAHGGSLETVLPEQTGLWVPVGDARTLSEAIMRTAGWQSFDPLFARQHIVKNFSKQQLQDKTLAVYRRLIEN